KLKVGDKVTMTIHDQELTSVTSPGKKLPEEKEVAAVATSSAKEQGETIQIANVKQMISTVQEIDPVSRMVTLVDPDGTPLTIKVTDDVKNLANVKVGDKVSTKVTQLVEIVVDESTEKSEKKEMKKSEEVK
ncbi:MAG: hypothetical protein ACE5GL_06340, partial [Calditrichia bacterium]